MKTSPTAALIIIGNEILSGRTLDINTQHIASKLKDSGIKLLEVRVIPDDHQVIVETVSTLKSNYSYLFTTGGIGPTHDDITVVAIAEVFNVPVELNKIAYDLVDQRFKFLGREMNAASAKMAYLPVGCKLINNNISGAPGFNLENVFVMAGVPLIMQAMLESILPMLERGPVIHSKSFELMLGESIIAEEFEQLQLRYPNIEMGSYPFKTGKVHGTNLVLQTTHLLDLESAYLEFNKIINRIIKTAEES